MNDPLYSRLFSPIEYMASRMEVEFAKVPPARKKRNKVAVFRVSDKHVPAYEAASRSSQTYCDKMYKVMESHINSVVDADKAVGKMYKSTVEEAIRRIKAVMPHKLVGREDSGVVEYARLVESLMNACASEMIIDWNVETDYAIKSLAERKTTTPEK